MKDVRRSGIGSDVHAARAALRLPSDSPQTFVFQRSFSRPGIVRTLFGAAPGLSKTLIFRAQGRSSGSFLRDAFPIPAGSVAELSRLRTPACARRRNSQQRVLLPIRTAFPFHRAAPWRTARYLLRRKYNSFFGTDAISPCDFPRRDPLPRRAVARLRCYTAQRFSDYSTINEGNIRILESGQRVIDLKQQKTGNHVVIPVRPELQAILDKYENRLPKAYEQKVNKFIKEVAREAGITEKIEVSYVQNGEKKTHLVEKCDLVKTRTARRSGVTNMYLAGIPTIAIMKITGHKTEKEIMKYIKITEEQTAMELMNHPYFSGR